ncbi:MAG: ComF family protein [Bacteroidetes bacterium]|nr:MAG: ComF family protein [Bacteroidota bacterium]
MKNNSIITLFLNDFLSLIFPQHCLTCNQILVESEEQLCTNCRFELPETNDFKDKNNDLYQKLSVYFPLQFASSYLVFTKLGKTQKILHALKYYNNPEIGEMLGRWYGNILISNGFENQFDVVIPVPLHPKKLKLRGYNQSAAFGKGLASGLHIYQEENGLIRQKNTVTQTKKKRMERWDNVSDIFEVGNKDIIYQKKVLLVDDVITTGATIGECLKVLHQHQPESLSVITIATPSR